MHHHGVFTGVDSQGLNRFNGANLSLSSDVDQDIYMFGLHERPLLTDSVYSLAATCVDTLDSGCPPCAVFETTFYNMTSVVLVWIEFDSLKNRNSV